LWRWWESRLSPKIEAGKGATIDAAFRDGCIKRNSMSGWQRPAQHWRWGNNADRAVFIAGYEQVIASTPKLSREIDGATQRIGGYCDGTWMGRRSH